MFHSENDSKVHSLFAVCQEMTKFQIREKNKKTENVWDFFYFLSFLLFFFMIYCAFEVLCTHDQFRRQKAERNSQPKHIF